MSPSYDQRGEREVIYEDSFKGSRRHIYRWSGDFGN